MNVLLDTCALLALARGDMPERAAAALRTAPEASVSVVVPGKWRSRSQRAGFDLGSRQRSGSLDCR